MIFSGLRGAGLKKSGRHGARMQTGKEGEEGILGVSAASAIEKPGVVVRDESADNQ
jgi:hypothetical protein